MPELPEVETVRKEIAPWMNGRVIKQACLVDAPDGPKYAHLDLAVGAQIEAVERRGKFLVCPLSNKHELIIHLGMTGVLTQSKPDKHCRVMLVLEGTGPLYFKDVRRFGRFCVVKDGDRSGLPTLQHMGPDPFDSSFTVDAFLRGLTSKSSIKTRLLSQRPVAGVGNIYADECLWISKIRPDRRSDSVSAAEALRLREAIVSVLLEAVRNGGTTVKDFETGTGQAGRYGGQLKVYGRAGCPCHRCGDVLSRTVLSQRTTVYCAKCQI